MTPRKRPRYMYRNVSHVYPKMYLGLVWDTCKIHAKYQDTCILLECNRAFKIHLGYIRIHERYMYPSGYTQDTSQYIRIRILITNPPKLDNKPPLTPRGGARKVCLFGLLLSHRTVPLVFVLLCPGLMSISIFGSHAVQLMPSEFRSWRFGCTWECKTPIPSWG